MLIAGILVALLGIAIAVFVHRGGGLFVICLGVALIIIDLALLADAESAAVGVLLFGMVQSGAQLGHTAGDDEPAVPARVGALPARRPVIWAFALGAVPLVTAFALQIADSLPDESVPLWIRTALVGLGTLATALGALWAQARVTPLRVPRNDEGEPLLPLSNHPEV